MLAVSASQVQTRGWNVEYSDLLAEFQIPTLERRRSELSLCLLYKLSKSLCFFPEGLINNKAPSAYATRSSSRPLLVQPFAKSTSHLNSYIPRTVSLWNSLPEQITRSTTFSLFKFQLSYYNL